MPTVLRWRGYRFFWYSWDGVEPPHVHIWKDRKECKIWLSDLSLAFNRGYSSADIGTLVARTAEERDRFREIWNEQFGK